jgi:elongator complex protein 3
MTLSEFRRILGSHPRASEHDSRTTFSKHELVRAYRFLCKEGQLEFDRQVLRRIQMKPTRTASGVAPVTVLTKPYPCPGRCVFCPTDDRMPKSYLSDEPGAMRAAYNEFDPYRQTASRIRALENIGHTTDKIELLILGGTWSFYPGDYQSWFVRRCLDAMNGREASSLDQAQRWNETAEHRNVGLVVETRPDWVSPAEIQRLRRLGVTKVQIGAQSLDTNVLEANQRGHSVDDTRKALRLLRLAGFKIALHWMPNLLGATPESDRTDFSRLWDDKGLRPDEIKIYPCALLAGTPLHRAWCNGAFQPYDQDTLVQLIADCKSVIPPYCRVNRITRDIPAPHIVAGNKKANLRQMAQQNMTKDGRYCRCVRCREVRRERIDFRQLRWSMLIYSTDVTTEYFFSAITTTNRLAGFLRLSLPKRGERARLALSDNEASAFDEITNCAMIRQVHVYGPALPVGSNSRGDAQHLGVGRQLIENACKVARGEGYESLAVISAVGTRDYYRRLGFELADTYMMMEL